MINFFLSFVEVKVQSQIMGVIAALMMYGSMTSLKN